MLGRSRSWKIASPAFLVALAAAVCILGVSLHAGGRDAGQPALAAIVDGMPVTMASYQQQLVYATAGYSGPGAPGASPTGRTVDQLLADRAVQQAIAEVLIDHTAQANRVTVSDAQVAAEIARMTAQAGGAKALRAQMNAARMTQGGLQSTARHTLLRNRLAVVLKDKSWLDHMVAKADIVYYVSDGAAGADGVPAIDLGHPAPPFVAVDLRGNPVSLADLHGRVVILNFWATWCRYCDTELPMLLRYAQAHRNLYVIALDHGESNAVVRAYAKAHHLAGLTVWLDSTGDAYANYLMTGLPATFFIDKRGFLRSYNYGALADAQTLADQAGRALDGLDNTYLNQGQ